MSAPQAESNEGGGGIQEYTPETPYEPIRDVSARFTVGDTNIPIINEGVTTEIRKQGPCDLNRSSTIHFPAKGLGSEWIHQFGVSESDVPSQPVLARPAEIELRDGNIGEWVTVHRGYVKGIGHGGGSTNDMKVQIGSVTDFLSSIPAGKTFNSTASVRDVLNYVVEELNESQPVFDGIQMAANLEDIADRSPITPLDTTDKAEAIADIATGPVTAASAFVEAALDYVLNSTKTFTKNRDTLIDVLDWVGKRANLRYWFEPNSSGSLSLVAASQVPSNTFKDTALGGDTALFGSNALYQIRPFNQLKLKGATTTRSATTGPMGVNSYQAVSNKYPQVTVQYTPLVERAGGPIQRQGESDASSLDALENEARSQLKDALDQAGGGMIQTTLEPTMTPYSVLKTHPAINAQLVTNVTPLSYEVESIKHVVQSGSHDSDDGVSAPHSDIRVSMWVDPNRIEVVDGETGMMNAK